MAEEKEHKTTALPSVEQLIRDTWELFKKTFVTYLKLIGLAIAYIFLASLIGALIALPFIFVAIGSHFQFFNHLSSFNLIMLILLVLWTILFFLSLIVLGIVFSIVSIFVLDGKSAPSIFELIKQSKKFFWAYFLTGLLGGLLTVGGMMLLLVPGLLIAFFLVFMTFEVVLDGQSGKSALQRSYYLIKTHFWEVLGRLVILEVAVIIVSSVLGAIAGRDSLLGLVRVLFSLFVSWYARAYLYLLYKEVRAKTTFPEHISLRWMWIVSAIGWIVVIGALSFGLTHLPLHPPKPMHPIHGNPV